ncbi:MAG: Ubiquinone biosynthesis O-methyltransferase [Phycisphaerales bacterium]|nr:Ubiquinone biosynthesis O-methyltransferase [Phycisphaerales bacterium]
MAKQERGPRKNQGHGGRGTGPGAGRRGSDFSGGRTGGRKYPLAGKPPVARDGHPRADRPPVARGNRRPVRDRDDFADASTAARDPADIGLGVRLVYEDEDVVVVDKPFGLVTAPMPGTPEHENPELRERSVFGVVKRYVKDQRRQRGTRVWIIHRLDKEATGLLVFAVSDRAYEQLKEEFRTKRAHRLYMAVVEGEITQDVPVLPGRTPQPASGIIKSALVEGPDGLMRSAGAAHGARGSDERGDRRGRAPRPLAPGEGQNAVTHWRVVATGAGRTLVQLRLDTGRKNQIRVHMKEMGHPLVGDLRYGGRSNPIARLCLHATELGFTHPATGQVVRFFSPPAQAFYGLVDQRPPENSLAGARPSIVGEPPAVARSSALKKESAGAREGGRDASDTSWDHVAEWYDKLIDERRSDHHENVILPGVLRLLRPVAGMRVLDLACGQGDFCRRLSGLGVRAVGVDASTKLIEAARNASEGSAGGADENDGGEGNAEPVFVVGDARELGAVAGLSAGGDEKFDAVTSIMALMNMDPLGPVLGGVAEVLKPGGSLVFVILHPAFRAPGQTSWGWEGERHQARRHAGTEAQKHGGERQYRRVDGYLSPGQMPIVMNPGKAAHGAEPVTTWTFHRPIQAYAKLLSEAGFVIEMIEEWPSARRSSPGPRAAEENRARREIPMFLAVRARKADAM